MADGTLEREPFADGTLGAPGLTPAVTAVHAELWKWVGRAKQEATLVLIKQTESGWVRMPTPLRVLSGSGRPVFLGFSLILMLFLSPWPTR